MTVRDHRSGHDTIRELPLVTRRARVVARDPVDRHRATEARAAVDRLLARRGDSEARALADREAFDRLRDHLAGTGQARLARRIATLFERIERPFPMTIRLGIDVPDGFDYAPGQYVGLRYGGTARAYSLASSPTRDRVEVCVRRVPDGKLSPRLCDTARVGDRLTVRGPYGELTFGDASTRDVVFLATGTGVAPFKGMIDYLYDTDRHVIDNRERDVWLFLGAAWEDDLPYREAFREYDARYDRFHFVPCLSRESTLRRWDGETDYVQHAFLERVAADRVTTPVGRELEASLDRAASDPDATIDPADADVYACGVNAMVHELERAARAIGVPDDRITAEGFG